MPISVKTPVYEGPLELLLELIEKRKLLINDISLASVTDEYIAQVNKMEELPVGEISEFIALAATLLLIKSRSLLPTLELSGEEEHDIKELEYRLALYRVIKNASRELRTSLESSMLHEGRMREFEPVFVPDSSTTQNALYTMARFLIEGFPQVAALPKVAVKKIVSLEETIERLAKRVSSAMSLSFREFAGGKHSRPEIIVSFLALLELVKQGIIRASQPQAFGDITLESDKISTPSYE
jgi:segregation and condensation protein A